MNLTPKPPKPPKLVPEFKVLRLGEVSVPYEDSMLDRPEKIAAIWPVLVVPAPWYDPEKEALVVFLLTAQLRVKGWNLVTLGLINQTLIAAREVYRPAIVGAAAQIVLAHGHLDGDDGFRVEGAGDGAGDGAGASVRAEDAKAAADTFMGELQGILDECRPSRLVLLDCDAAIHQVVEFEPGDHDLTAFVPQGGGGTDFRPVFQWVADNGMDPAAIIYFTDLCGTFPEAEAAPWPTLWVNYGDADTEAPFGETIPTSQRGA